MKKLHSFLAILLVLSFSFTLISCGGVSETTLPSTVPSTEAPVSSESAVAPPTPTSTPTETAPTETVTPAPTHKMVNGVCACGCGAKTTEILSGKSAIFYGDSIVIATGETAHPTWGYAGRIHRDYALSRYKNAGVNGASISDCRGTNLVVNQIMAKGPKYHFVVLEGGTNDAWDSVAVGKMSDIAPKDVTSDTFAETRKTFCGGLENVLYQTKKNNPSSVIVYVITPKMSMNAGKLTNMREYVDATIAICEKWGVPYINFYDMGAEYYGDNMINYFTNYIPDGVHPNSECYEMIAPLVADAMAEAYLNK